jgi:hypothetical protein
VGASSCRDCTWGTKPSASLTTAVFASYSASQFPYSNLRINTCLQSVQSFGIKAETPQLLLVCPGFQELGTIRFVCSIQMEELVALSERRF